MLKQYILGLFNTGVHGAQNEAEANRIRLTNRIALVPLLLLIFSTVYCIFEWYPRIVIINTVAIAGTAAALYLNFRKKYAVAKSVLICTDALTILVYYKLMMDEPSMFFYYFVVILEFIVFYNPEKEKKILGSTIVFVLLCIVLTIWLPNKYFQPFPLSAALHHFIFVFNSCACILLCAFFVINIFRVNILNEKLLLEAKRVAEHAAKAKTIFLSNMSHELRTPLNGIIGTSHILKNEAYLPSQDYHLTVLANLSEHMLGLVNNILDFSKIDAGKLELNSYRFNVKNFIHKLDITFRQLFEDKGISYRLDTDERLAALDVFADELRLQQVMNNLISNALKFTDKDGQVTVSAAIIRKEEDSVKILFSVSDNGIGVASHHLGKIFDSFSQGDSATTRKYGGSGLGLTICRNLINLFDGTLHVKSEKGKGSQFYFDIALPLYKSQQVNTKQEEILTVENLKSFKVLVAEDNKVNMMVAKKVMQRWGIQVTEAENGLIAYEKCKEQDFDLVLIDLEMPVMDGRTAVKKINMLDKGMPTVAFTAGVYENMKEDLLEAGFTDYLLKPFMPDDLYRKIVSVKNNHSRSQVQD
jgi:signal transduction histidine kinase/ActR/RegA family two-component response regulator